MILHVSEKLKSKFCKDCKLPIGIFVEPYFSKRLSLYQKYYDSLSLWDTFTSSVLNNTRYSNEQDYYEDYNRIKDEAINSIKNSEGYEEFNQENMNKYAVPASYTSITNKDIYHDSNIGKTFISIDMKSANFSSLRYYDPDIFGGSCTWEEFISKFTDVEHIIKSKYIRQVILGNCNPKRQITFEKFLMYSTIDSICCTFDNIRNRVVYFSNDEVIIDCTSCKDTHTNSSFSRDKLHGPVKFAKSISDYLVNYFRLPIRYHIEVFTLNKIAGTGGYMKEIQYGNPRKIILKKLNKFEIPFAIKYLENMGIDEYDKTFVFEGKLARFID